MNEGKILVVGIGNILMQDDGIGIQVVQALQKGYCLPENVRVIDGGIAGFAWLEELSGAGRLLIIDAMLGDGPPGTVYRLSPDQLANRQGPTLSPHEIGVEEMLGMASALNRLPHTLILGVQPHASDQPGQQLSKPLQQALPQVVDSVVKQLTDWGARLREAKK